MQLIIETPLGVSWDHLLPRHRPILPPGTPILSKRYLLAVPEQCQELTICLGPHCSLRVYSDHVLCPARPDK